MTAATRLLLVGGGHTHLEVLRRQLLEPLPNVALTLVSAVSRHHKVPPARIDRAFMRK